MTTSIQTAFDLISSHQELSDFSDSISDDAINMAEDLLQLEFHPSYKAFLSKA